MEVNAQKEASFSSRFSTYMTPFMDYVGQNPYHTALIFVALIFITILAAFKCKWLNRICGRICGRRRNRRRRKPRTHYYYLNKTAGEAGENGVGESLMGDGVQLSKTKSKKSKRSKKDKPMATDLSLRADEGSM